MYPKFRHVEETVDVKCYVSKLWVLNRCMHLVLIHFQFHRLLLTLVSSFYVTKGLTIYVHMIYLYILSYIYSNALFIVKSLNCSDCSFYITFCNILSFTVMSSRCFYFHSVALLTTNSLNCSLFRINDPF